MISRRTALVAGAVVAAGGIGYVVAVVQPPDRVAGPAQEPPPQLPAALARELSLVAGLDAALRRTPSLRSRLEQVRGDHSAHAGALRSVLAGYQAPSPSTPAPSAAALTLAQLRAAEAAAARAAAADSLALHGAHAALLASISAGEATHAEILT